MAEQNPPSQPPGEPTGTSGGLTPASASAASIAEQALQAAQAAVASLRSSAPSPAASTGIGPADVTQMDPELAAAFAQAEAESKAAQPAPPPGVPVQPFTPPSFDRVSSSGSASGMDLLSDVNLNVKIELGRTRMVVEDVLKLSEGAVVELDKLAGDPVDVYVNERHIARGEVLVLNDNFCVRINEIIADLGEGGSPGTKPVVKPK